MNRRHCLYLFIILLPYVFCISLYCSGISFKTQQNGFLCVFACICVHLSMLVCESKSLHMPQGMCKTYRTTVTTTVGPSHLFSGNKGLSSAVHCCTWQLSWLVNFWGSPFFFPNPHRNTGITGVQYCFQLLNESCGVKLRTSCVTEKSHLLILKWILCKG